MRFGVLAVREESEAILTVSIGNLTLGGQPPFRASSVREALWIQRANFLFSLSRMVLTAPMLSLEVRMSIPRRSRQTTRSWVRYKVGGMTSTKSTGHPRT